MGETQGRNTEGLLVVQWLRLGASAAGGVHSIPDTEPRSRTLYGAAKKSIEGSKEGMFWGLESGGWGGGSNKTNGDFT